MERSISTHSALTKACAIGGSISVRFGDICGILLMFIAISTTWDVFMRYVFHKPSIWVVEVSQYMLAAIACLGSCYTLKLRRHIALDLFVERLPHTVKGYLGLVTGCISFFCYTILAILSFERWFEAILSGERTWTSLKLPFSFLYSYFFIGMLILAIQCLCNIMEDIIQMSRKAEK
jgi:C4-dicarboxylate transporter, DctQ subunit